MAFWSTRLNQTTGVRSRVADHSAAVFEQVDDLEWITPPMRMLRLGLSFVALIIANSYTANLAAFLSAPRFTVHGPTTLAKLRDAKVCVVGVEDDDVRPWVGSIWDYQNANPERVCTCLDTNYTRPMFCNGTVCQIQSTNALKHCHKLLDAGSVEAVIGLVRGHLRAASTRTLADLAVAAGAGRLNSRVRRCPQEPQLNMYLRDRCDVLVKTDYTFGISRYALSLPFTEAEGEWHTWAANARVNISVRRRHSHRGCRFTSTESNQRGSCATGFAEPHPQVSDHEGD